MFEVGSFSRSAFIDRRESARTVTRDNVTEESLDLGRIRVSDMFTRGVARLVGKVDGRGFRGG